jgi:phosphoadenosine phosphosulfate reductase
MLREISSDFTVMTLDTGLIFPETHNLIAEIEDRFNIYVKRIHPAQNLEEQRRAYGDALWERDPGLCCQLRKVVPLQQTLSGYDAWITGLRRDQSTHRANTPIISWDKRHDMVKLCPFATWTESMIWAYIQAYDLPYNTMHDQGYPSIGCHTCTQPVTSDNQNDKRAGRWSKHNKTECGIHVQE